MVSVVTTTALEEGREVATFGFSVLDRKERAKFLDFWHSAKSLLFGRAQLKNKQKFCAQLGSSG